jgi:hypothetical protein
MSAEVPRTNGQPFPPGQHDPSTGPLPNPRKQLVYRGVNKYVLYDATLPDGERFTLVIDTPHEQICFPMADVEATAMGKGLVAPHVIRPE